MGRGPQRSPNLVYSPATFRNKGKKISREEILGDCASRAYIANGSWTLLWEEKKKFPGYALFEAKYVFYTFVLGFELLYSENL